MTVFSFRLKLINYVWGRSAEWKFQAIEQKIFHAFECESKQNNLTTNRQSSMLNRQLRTSFMLNCCFLLPSIVLILSLKKRSLSTVNLRKSSSYLNDNSGNRRENCAIRHNNCQSESIFCINFNYVCSLDETPKRWACDTFVLAAFSLNSPRGSHCLVFLLTQEIFCSFHHMRFVCYVAS